MKNKLWILSVAVGALLLLSALGLCLFNFYEDNKAFEQSQAVMDELRELIPEPPTTTTTLPGVTENDLFAEFETQPTTSAEMPTLNVNGGSYCGFITLPTLGIELPVMNNWSYPNLKIAPCRYSGSAEGNDLIIAAHNYSSHFGQIGALSQGDEVWFTAANGKIYFYEVQYSEVIGGYDVGQMFSGKVSDWDLTLFTCTLSGQSRVTIRAQRLPDFKEEGEDEEDTEEEE